MEHKHILVVDDESQITRVLRTSLSSHGYDIRVANDGETALEIMKDWTPDLVITDLAMPNMDGLELCRKLRAKTQIPIIVLSVRGEERTKVKALDAGADDYVTKPFGMEELLARVRANLRRGRDRRFWNRANRVRRFPDRSRGRAAWWFAITRSTLLRRNLTYSSTWRATPARWSRIELCWRRCGEAKAPSRWNICGYLLRNCGRRSRLIRILPVTL